MGTHLVIKIFYRSWSCPLVYVTSLWFTCFRCTLKAAIICIKTTRPLCITSKKLQTWWEFLLPQDSALLFVYKSSPLTQMFLGNTFLRVTQLARVVLVWLTCMEGVFLWWVILRNALSEKRASSGLVWDEKMHFDNVSFGSFRTMTWHWNIFRKPQNRAG